MRVAKSGEEQARDRRDAQAAGRSEEPKDETKKRPGQGESGQERKRGSWRVGTRNEDGMGWEKRG